MAEEMLAPAVCACKDWLPKGAAVQSVSAKHRSRGPRLKRRLGLEDISAQLGEMSRVEPALEV